MKQLIKLSANAVCFAVVFNLIAFVKPKMVVDINLLLIQYDLIRHTVIRQLQKYSGLEDRNGEPLN